MTSSIVASMATPRCYSSPTPNLGVRNPLETGSLEGVRSREVPSHAFAGGSTFTETLLMATCIEV